MPPEPYVPYCGEAVELPVEAFAVGSSGASEIATELAAPVSVETSIRLPAAEADAAEAIYPPWPAKVNPDVGSGDGLTTPAGTSDASNIVLPTIYEP